MIKSIRSGVVTSTLGFESSISLVISNLLMLSSGNVVPDVDKSFPVPLVGGVSLKIE